MCVIISVTVYSKKKKKVVLCYKFKFKHISVCHLAKGVGKLEWHHIDLLWFALSSLHILE